MAVDAGIEFDYGLRPLHNYLAARQPRLPDNLRVGGLASAVLYEWLAQHNHCVLEGLELGACYRITDYGPVSMAILSAETVEDALKVIKTYMLLFNPDIAAVEVARLARQVRVTVSLKTDTGRSESAHLFRANVLAAASFRLMADIRAGDAGLLALTLPQQLAQSGYQAFFGVPVALQGQDIVFYLDRDILARPIPTANPATFQLAIGLTGEHFNALLEREMGGLKQRILRLLESFPETYPDIGWMAQHLKITERTLRRRLDREAASYREIIHQVRFARARQLLAQTALSVEQVSARLGYSDSTNFRHAFRRWTGQTVADYRRQQQTAASTANSTE